MSVCKSKDGFVFEQSMAGEAHWVARLSNGETVYQDDLRPDESIPSAWIRLADYVREHGLSITALWLEFRDNIQKPLPENAEGYFFCKSAGAVWPGDSTIGFYIIGCLVRDKVRCQRWKIPELLVCETEIRDTSNKLEMGEGKFLIRNPQ